MFDTDTLSAFLRALLYYSSPLLILAGVAGFAVSLTLWTMRK